MPRWISDNRGAIKKQAELAMAAGLNKAAEMLLGDANLTVPHDEGPLEASGRVAQASSGNLNAAVGYDTVYAVYQHETPGLNHQGKGRHAWLERTLAERQDVYRQVVLGAIGQGLGGGGSSGPEMFEYTTRAGKTRMATARQIQNWTRNQ